MPTIESREIGVALDMAGCPNRCRHCYLGCQPNGRFSEADLRWVAELFRSFVRPGEGKPFIEDFHVSSWVREPDFSDDYRRLAELETELCGQSNRYELLSVWRLANDLGYAEWAKQIGPDTCQIAFFGLEETQDWFLRRKGAFADCIAATERLLEVGMKPRWELFLTKKILPDLDGLAKLIESMRLRERVAALGGEFVVFVFPPSMCGEAVKIAHLNATLEDTKLVPSEIVESTKWHFGTEKIWTTEADTVVRILSDPEDGPDPIGTPEPHLWFFVMHNWDVYANVMSTDPWWRLGNLKTDTVGEIVASYENDMPLAFRVRATLPRKELARGYGDPQSLAVVNGIEDYWLEQYCASNYVEPDAACQRLNLV